MFATGNRFSLFGMRTYTLFRLKSSYSLSDVQLIAEQNAIEKPTLGSLSGITLKYRSPEGRKNGK